MANNKHPGRYCKAYKQLRTIVWNELLKLLKNEGNTGIALTDEALAEELLKLGLPAGKSLVYTLRGEHRIPASTERQAELFLKQWNAHHARK